MDELRASTPGEGSTKIAPFLLCRHEVALLLAHMVRAYPEEACGLILETSNGDRGFLASSNEAHEAVGSFEISREARRQAARSVEAGGRILVVYHSHPNGYHGFSATDRAAAAPNGRPLFPDAIYLVLVAKGPEDSIVGFLGYRWDADAKDFTEVPVDLEG